MVRSSYSNIHPGNCENKRKHKIKVVAWTVPISLARALYVK